MVLRWCVFGTATLLGFWLAYDGQLDARPESRTELVLGRAWMSSFGLCLDSIQIVAGQDLKGTSANSDKTLETSFAFTEEQCWTPQACDRQLTD